MSTWSRAWAGLVAALLVCLPALPASAQQPPPPGLGIRLLEAPTARADDPRARAYVVDRVQPGQRFSRRFEVSNGDATPMQVRLYAATAEISGGGFSIAAEGDEGEVPAWVRITPASAVLQPGERLEVTADFAVPEDVPEGEYYGALVAERPPPQGQDGVSVGLRAGIRVYLSSGDGQEPASDFTVDTLRAGRDAEGRPVVEAAVTNTGGRALDMAGELRLEDGPAGLAAGPFEAQVGTTLGIGQSAPVLVLLDPEIPAGPWRAVLELRSGKEVRTSQAQITFPEGVSTQADAVAAVEVQVDEGNPWVIAAAALIGLLSLLLLALSVRKVRNRRGQHDQARPAAQPVGA